MLDLVHAKLIYIAFAASALAEFYFFMMQRAALEISRASGIDIKQGRLMLPLWYLLLWPARVIKWASVIQIGLWHGWIAAAGLLLATFLFSIFVPIPKRQFIPVFRKKLAKELSTGVQSKEYARLYALLFEASKDRQLD